MSIARYRDSASLEERKKRSNSLLLKHQDKFPVILERNTTEKRLPNIDKNKLLVAQDLTVAGIIQILRNNLKIDEFLSVYIVVANHNVVLSGSQSMSYVYNNYKNEDGFLYLEYCSENVFG